MTIAQSTLKGFASPHQLGDKMRINELGIIPYSGSSTLLLNDFIENGHSISDGQSFDNVKVVSNTLVVVAGRKESPTPVDWVKRQKGFSVGASRPKDLNFAVSGDLELVAARVSASDGSTYSGTLICRDVAFAQGHSNGLNDWWMYSNLPLDTNAGGMNLYGNLSLTIRCEDPVGRKYDVDMTDKVLLADHNFGLAGVRATSK